VPAPPFRVPCALGEVRNLKAYVKENGLEGRMEQAAHIVWATGGSLVPEEIREEYRQTYLD
jgi:D-serine dehydratase